MTYSYQVVPIARRSRIEPGEAAEIEIFISGSGDIESAKLHVLHTQDELIDLNSPGTMEYSVDYQEDRKGEPKLMMGDDALTEFKIDNWGTMAFISDAIFFTPEETGESEQIEMNREEVGFQPIVGEAPHQGNPPLLLSLNTKPNARPGNYEIPFILTYGDEKNPQQSVATVDIHVQNWVERNRKTLEILATIGTMAIVLSSIVTAVASVM